jgi:hypothetical protein
MYRAFVFFLLILSWGAAAAQEAPAKSPSFDRTEVMIPMRDGVRLQTAIFAPKGHSEPLPILLARTPYGVPANDDVLTKPGAFEALVADGYIFVFQNIRGRFGSEGQFEMMKPLRATGETKGPSDESTDAYDTIDWLVKNVPNNNHRVGITGISYPGWTAVMALISPHPALKAASEQASPDDMFVGDDFHHNGAFRLDYGLEYAVRMERGKSGDKPFEFDRFDLYDWFLDLGPLANVNSRYLHDQVPTWNDFVKHHYYDFFWRVRAFDPTLRITTVPLLNVAGWWDQEDFFGPQRIYQLLEGNDFKNVNYFVAGPWYHGGWARENGDHLGPLNFGSETSRYFRTKIEAPWFRHWLHDEGKGKLDLAEATVFQTGTNVWKTYAAWPPREAEARKLYFQANGKLSFTAPADKGDAFDSYVSDPANPVPYCPRPIHPVTHSPVPHDSQWREWQVQDQRFVDHRPDVLTWQTEPLADDLTITGDILADLFAATNCAPPGEAQPEPKARCDADWVVKLIDVYPETGEALPGGYELMISGEVFRARFHNRFEKPAAIPADAVLEYKIDLHTNDHVFLKGHRIMVQVQSTWFPLIDRNPQKWVDNIYKAADLDYVKATQRIYRSAESPSGIVLPVMAK